MIVYIAGPMTGCPDLNYPAFHAAADTLTTAGHVPLDPARAEGRESCKTWLDYMRAALRDIAEADGVAMLPGWEDSRGASLEHCIGTELGLDVRPVAAWTRPSLADVVRASFEDAVPPQRRAPAPCPDCHHTHTPTGCVGEPSPSDLWAGVTVASCDCDDPTTDQPDPEESAR